MGASRQQHESKVMIKLTPGQRMIKKHIFRYRIEGRSKPIVAPAITYNAKRKVSVILMREHILAALKRHGQGDASNCAMAICIHTHSHLFPHEIKDIEFVDSRAYCVTKYFKNGLPSHNVMYDHDHADIAKDFDTPAGLKRLLARIDRDGPITVYLRPLTSSSGSANKTGSKEDGSRTRVYRAGSRPKKKGSGLRIMRATQGLFASERLSSATGSRRELLL